MHMMPVFEGCEYFGGTVDKSLFERGLCLPSGSSLTDSQIERVIDALHEIFK